MTPRETPSGDRLTTRRELLVAIGAGALWAPFAPFAQQGKVRRIGFLAARARSTQSNPDVYYDAFVQGMREYGYIEGKNLVTEWRYADGRLERLPELAAEFVRSKVEVIVTHGNQGARAAQQATAAIPVVIAAVSDPVAAGIVASLARPGGNITGLSVMALDVSPKQIELLHLLIPKLSRIGLLVNPLNSGHMDMLKSTQAAARRIGGSAFAVEARSAEELESRFAGLKQQRADVLIVAVDTFFISQRRQIVELAAKHRVATMHSYREDVQAGALMSYGQNLADFYRRAARFVDKILQGAKPADLPIEQPSQFHLALNRKTAKALGITVPKELLLRADDVIE